MRRGLILLGMCSIGLHGCGSTGGGVNPGGGAPPAGVVAPQADAVRTGPTGLFTLPQVSGQVDLQNATSAMVRLRRVGGVLRVEAALDNGIVLLADATLAEADRLALAGGGDQLPSGDPSFVWVTPVSTLLAAYRDAHPGATVGLNDLQKVKRFLKISQRESINRPFSSHYFSQFSPRVFAQAAGGQLLPAFASSLVPQIDAGLTRPFVETRPGALLRAEGKIFRDFETPLENPLNNIWSGGLTLTLLSKGAGWLGSLFGLGKGTQNALQNIQDQLNQIQTELVALTQDLGVINLTNTIQPSVDRIGGAITLQNTTLQSDLVDYKPFSADNTFLGNVDAQTWATPANITQAQNSTLTILGTVLNTGPSPAGNLLTYQLQNRAQQYGSGLNNYKDYNGINWANFYDFRNDIAATPKLVNASGYYVGEVTLGANWLSECATQALSANNVSAAPTLRRISTALNGSGATQGVANGIPADMTNVGNGLAALSKRTLQQGPVALLGGAGPCQNVCGAPADAETVSGTKGSGILDGTLWATYAEIPDQRLIFSSPSPIDARHYNVNGWYDWVLPSQSEAEQLIARAKLAAKQQGYTGKNPTAFGLHQMGLLSDSSYQTAQNQSDVCIYTDWSVDSSSNPHLYTTSSAGDHKNNGLSYFLAEGQTLIDPGVQLRALFNPQSGATSLAMLVKPLPGAPKGSQPDSQGQLSAGQASQGGAPTAVANSSSAQKLGANPWIRNSDLALAGNFIPDEVVVEPDSANPNQMRAYAIWTVGLKRAPSDYTSPISNKKEAGPGYNSYIGNFGYSSGVFASNYLIYTDITDVAEWLSSDTSSVEVANFPSATVTVANGTLTSAQGAVMFENATLGANSTTILGGTIVDGSINAGISQGGTTLNGPAFSGDVNQFGVTSGPNATPVNASISGGSVVSGGVTVTSSGTLISPVDGSQVGTITNATLSGASLAPSLLSVASNGSAGLLTAHKTNPTTITASWMYSPSTITPVNLAASAAKFLSGSVSFTPQTANTALASLVLSPNYTKVTGVASIPFYVTGFNLDGTFQDATSPNTLANIQWQVYRLGLPGLPSPGAAAGLAFDANPGFANLLNVPSGFDGYVAVKASYQGKSTWSFLNVKN